MLHLGLRPNKFSEGEEGDAGPADVELAPGGDAMEVAHVFELREGVEFLPGEGPWVLDQAADFQAPIARRNLRADAEIEHGKAGGEVLARREPVIASERRFATCRAILRAKRSFRSMKLGFVLLTRRNFNRRLRRWRGLCKTRFHHLISGAPRSGSAPASDCPAPRRGPASSAGLRKNAAGSLRASPPSAEQARDCCVLRRFRA